MGKVYAINTLGGDRYYVSTSREADRERPGGEGPESIDQLDAAEECNSLQKDCDDAERTIRALRLLLSELVDMCPDDVLEKTNAGRRAVKFLADNPPPPATAADRDGSRSYGGG